MKKYIISCLVLISIACGPNIFVGPMGPKGPAGNDGTNGSTGNTGASGVSGATGSTGASGTSCSVVSSMYGAIITCPDGSTYTLNNVTAVQFCPQAGATFYPFNFPEYGLVVGNAIYAVYWGTTSTSGGNKTLFFSSNCSGHICLYRQY